MSPLLAQRLLVLAAAATLAAVGGLAVAARDAKTTRVVSTLPRPSVSDRAGWATALAGVRARPLAGRVSGCDTLLGAKTLGVGHSVLPCGAKIYLAFGGKTVLTTVVDRGPSSPAYDFEVTPGLAELIGLPASGVQTIRWSFARAP